MQKLSRPAAMIALSMAGVLTIGTTLLMMPFASTGEPVSFIDALFTATSCLCVTGLTTLDNGIQWTTGGYLVELALMQTGGLGAMVIVMMLAVVTARHLGIRDRLTVDTATQIKTQKYGVKGMLASILATTLVVEGVVAALLTARFLLHYGQEPLTAAWYGIYHAISAFNNAGFALRSESLIPFNRDPFILLPIAAAIIIGGLGYPVIIELARKFGTNLIISMHTKIMLVLTPVILGLGTLYVLATESFNEKTLGPMSLPAKLMGAFFQAVTSRTAGFDALGLADARHETWLGTDLIMFIGAGPAGTGGGLKVTTLAIVLAVIVSEMRGTFRPTLFRRAIPNGVIRQSIAMMGLFGALVFGATALILFAEPFAMDQVLFEVVSALSTTGLSTGITPEISSLSKAVLILLMFLGRVGPVTIGTALVLRSRPLPYTYPEERPIIG